MIAYCFKRCAGVLLALKIKLAPAVKTARKA
jgi:hypothetical protein